MSHTSFEFPRSARYNPEWLMASISGAANPLWITEWLASALDLRPGMKILDLGCGRAVSSIFLHREFNVEVWAADLWFSASENLQRICDADAQHAVFPIHADARALPFPRDFFDAIVSIDSFVYYGTDDLYLANVARFVKPGGQIAFAGAGLMQELPAPVPAHLRAWWTHDLCCLHSPPWWRRHWERTGIVSVEVSDAMPNGWQLWLDWHRQIAPENVSEIAALEADRGEFLGYTRLVGRRNLHVELPDPIETIPTTYEKKPIMPPAT